jgi:glycosyltransferase involved in cell wall biosynthesis
MGQTSRSETGRLRIGVDARELLGAATGVGRYLGELLRRWTERPDRDRRLFILYSPEPLPLPLPGGAVEYRVIGPAGDQKHGTWWEQIHLRRAVAADRPDAFFAPAYTAPLLSGIPLALTIHDIAFEAHPEWFRFRERTRRRFLTRRCAKRAAVIFTDSAFSQSEIGRHYGLDASRIHVLPPGIAPRHRQSPSESQPTAREKVVLYVGSIFNRRRVPDLIAAFALVVRDLPDARLVIVGDNRSWPPLSLAEIADSHGVAANVSMRTYVPDAELAALYTRASVFAFLSEYEGFGLTPLEALAAGVPIVVLDTRVAREVYGDAARYVQAGDIRATAEALARILRDPASAEPLMHHAPAVLARYSWDRCASATLDGIEGIVRREP